MTRFDWLYSKRLTGVATIAAVGGVGSSERDSRPWVRMTNSLFCPRGVQRPDRGSINGWRVVNVLPTANGDVNHHFNGAADAFKPGQMVSMTVDGASRRLSSSYLAAGRLIAAEMRQIYWELEVIEASFWPNRSFVLLGGEGVPSTEEARQRLIPALRDAIESDLPVIVSGNPRYPATRRVQIGGFRPLPCISVYPQSLSELGSIELTHVENSDHLLRIAYRVKRVATPKGISPVPEHSELFVSKRVTSWVFGRTGSPAKLRRNGSRRFA